MWIAVLIGLLVMDSMHGNPENRSALERQSATQRKEILESQWNFIRAVGVEPVISHADT